MLGSAVRTRLPGRMILVGVVLLAAGGCSTVGAAAPDAVADGSGSAAAAAQTTAAAGAAGGACHLLDYSTIQELVGLTFAVSAAAQDGESYSCVVRPTDTAAPDLSLSVTSTSSDTAGFHAAVAPEDSAEVEGLGQAAYSTQVTSGDDVGPGVEIGWLDGHQRLLVLRLRLETTAAADEAAGYTDQLVELAKTIDYWNT